MVEVQEPCDSEYSMVPELYQLTEFASAVLKHKHRFKDHQALSGSYLLQVVNLVKNHIVEETIQSTLPFLPYVYICSSNPATYNLTGNIYVGCGDDVGSPSLVLQNNAGGGSVRTNTFCVAETVTVQVRSHGREPRYCAAGYCS